MFEKFDLKPAEGRNGSSKFKELTRNLKRKVIIGAVAITSMVGVGQHVRRLNEYNSATTFNQAFKAAREKGEQSFYWQDKKYTTRTVDKEFSDLFLESKDFLISYYSSDYFKNKYKYIPSQFDLDNAQFELSETINNNPRLKYLSDKIEHNKILTTTEWGEYMHFLNESEKILLDKNISSNPDFKEKVGLIIESKSKGGKISSERIENLKKPTYFSITDQKGSKNSDGVYSNKTGAVFVYKGKPQDSETTPVHELGHKSTKGNSGMEIGDWVDLTTKARKSVEINHLQQKYFENFISGDFEGDRQRTEDWINYITNPTEIDARQNSTRFWLFKHFKGYKPDTVFTKEHFNFLHDNAKLLPYDIRQLLDIFPDSEDFIDNMNKF